MVLQTGQVGEVGCTRVGGWLRQMPRQGDAGPGCRCGTPLGAPALCHQNHPRLHALACFVLLALNCITRSRALARPLVRTTNTILVQKIENSTRNARP